MKYLNWLFALIIVCASINFASCSDDDDNTLGGGGETEQPGEGEVTNPAGDDFYAYVNGAWLAGLENTGESQGYHNDMAELLASKTSECLQHGMQDVALVVAAMFASTPEENESRVEEIISEIVDPIETKEDAYLAIGKCVKMGLIDNYLKLFMDYDGDGAVGFSFAPKNADQNSDINDDADADDEVDFPTRKVVSQVIEGAGLSSDYFTYDGSSDAFFDEILQSSVDDLKDFIDNAIREELLPYCGDVYAQQITEGRISSTSDYFDYEFDGLFTYSISRKMYELFITEEVKAQFLAYGEELRDVFAKRIENNLWLSNATKQQALYKLENMQFYVGGPDEWYDEYTADVKGELLVDDIIELKSTRSRIIEATIGKDSRKESMMLAMYSTQGESLNVVNATYSPQGNALVIYPSFMMAPEYSATMDAGKMYATFYVFGHEMTHGFDLVGSQFDAFGYETDWWTPEDRSKFETLAEDFSAQIGTFEVAPGVYAPTTTTIDENVADLGGLNIAFDALTAYLTKQGVTGEELKAHQRAFFEHHAYRYHEALNDDDFQAQLLDEHSLGKIRVNGMVQHMDAWYDLYNVNEGDALYLPADKRITIW